MSAVAAVVGAVDAIHKVGRRRSLRYAVLGAESPGVQGCADIKPSKLKTLRSSKRKLATTQKEGRQSNSQQPFLPLAGFRIVRMVWMSTLIGSTHSKEIWSLCFYFVQFTKDRPRMARTLVYALFDAEAWGSTGSRRVRPTFSPFLLAHMRGWRMWINSHQVLRRHTCCWGLGWGSPGGSSCTISSIPNASGLLRWMVRARAPPYRR